MVATLKTLRNGTVQSIVQYTDGTSTVSMRFSDGVSIEGSFPFFGTVDTRCLGKQAQFCETLRRSNLDETPKTLYQSIKGAGFAYFAESTPELRKRIWDNGRIVEQTYSIDSVASQ